MSALSGSFTMGVNVPVPYRIHTDFKVPVCTVLCTLRSAHHHNLGRLLAFSLSALARSLQTARVLRDVVPGCTVLQAERLEEATQSASERAYRDGRALSCNEPLPSKSETP